MRKLVYLSVFGLILFFAFEGCEKDDLVIKQDRIEVVLRKIGHDILLNSNDSISLVRPIVHKEDKYRIQFESNFNFLPDDFIESIDTIIKNSLPYHNYIVQVESCETKEIVYSYEISDFLPTTEIACKTRPQPEGCYEVIIQFLPENETNSLIPGLLVLIAISLLLIGLYIYKKRKPVLNSETIKIGEYLYDSKKMILIRQEKTIELTSKESDLLNLLYESVNNTVDRETILNKVWGDEGDYVGRTLDVYVSKLRKKLENDSTIQLKNIRGIGYKLIVDN